MSEPPLCSSPWWSLDCVAPDADLLTTLAFEHGAAGVQEGDEGHLTVFVRGSREEAESLASQLKHWGATSVGLAAIDNHDWMKGNWLIPRTIGPFTVRPLASPGEIERRPDHLALVPGMGFGTGDHATTAMLLEFMGTMAPPTTNSILDVGTGSGILAIAAAKLWNTSVLAIDIDSDALNNAHDNAVCNACREKITLRQCTASEVTEGQFPIIIANLYAELLIQEKEILTRLAAPGAHLLLSGIMEQLRGPLEAAFAPPQWRLVRSVARDGWMGYEFERAR